MRARRGRRRCRRCCSRSWPALARARSPCRAARRSGARRRSAGRCGRRTTAAFCAAIGAVPGLAAGRGSCRSCRRAAAGLAEVGEQEHAPAAARSRRAEHARRASASRRACARRPPRDCSISSALLHHVGQAVGHPGVGRLAVAAGAAGLLVVALDALAAGRGARRSARRACRCPCRRRWSPPSRRRPRAGSGCWLRRAGRGVEAGVVGQRRRCPGRPATRRSPRPCLRDRQ